MVSYKLSQICKQYPCSILLLLILLFYMKPDTISIFISGIRDLPLQTRILLPRNIGSILYNSKILRNVSYPIVSFVIIKLYRPYLHYGLICPNISHYFNLFQRDKCLIMYILNPRYYIDKAYKVTLRTTSLSLYNTWTSVQTCIQTKSFKLDNFAQFSYEYLPLRGRNKYDHIYLSYLPCSITFDDKFFTSSVTF